MEFKINTDKKVIVFYLEGGIDIIRASKMEKEFDAIYNQYKGYNILFNLSKSGLISSSGFGIMINYQRKRSANGIKVVVSNLSKENNRILGLMGVEGLIEVFSDESDFIELA
ncbi:MAG: STAS domain-containing protein [Leptospiraceae bacterium]|nr:STAS domain-containing protein [Leptospiraceae bacterium]